MKITICQSELQRTNPNYEALGLLCMNTISKINKYLLSIVPLGFMGCFKPTLFQSVSVGSPDIWRYLIAPF